MGFAWKKIEHITAFNSSFFKGSGYKKTTPTDQKHQGKAAQPPLSCRIHCRRFYKITGIEFLGFKDKPPHELNELERWVWANISIYGSYDFMDPRFDMTNLRRFAPHLTAPALDKAMARRLLDYAEEDQWGRRKAPQTEPALLDVAALLQEKQTADIDRPTTASVGLDVLGPGGGQWNLAFMDGRLYHFEAGLPPASEKAILCIPVDKFAQWQQLGDAAAESLQSFLHDSNGSAEDLSREVAEALFN